MDELQFAVMRATGRPVHLAVIVAAMAVFCFTPIASGSARLSSRQFKAVDGLYAAWLPAGDRKFPNIASLRRACRAFDTNDELLRAMRPGCDLTVQAMRHVTVMSRCKGTSRCRSATRAALKAFQKLAARQAVENRALDRALSPGPCRNALRTSPNDMKAFNLVLATFRELVRALTTRGTPDLTVVQHLRSQAQAALRQSSPGAGRATFRKACR